MGPRFSVYISISQWVGFYCDWVWGEATHFVHELDTVDGGRPLNKEWSATVMVGWLHISICYDRGWKDDTE